MSSELRRSFKEKAKEKLAFGFGLSRRANTIETAPQSPSPDDPSLPGSAPPGLTQHDAAIDGATEFGMLGRTQSQQAKVDRTQTDNMTLEGLKTTAQMMERSGSQKSKRRSRHLVQPKGTITYEVAGCDTLMSVAAQFETTTSELKKLNKLMSTMVFPGQVLYIPDKDYIPSESSTPTSPTCAGVPESSPPGGDTNKATTPPANGTTSPTYTGKPAFDLKLMRRNKGPGLAERQKSTDSRDDENHSMEENCIEKFIKVNVKHITDGQGVVNGVLLVTPNAIMFDPNVSDPLVVDRGAEEYGMIAPMETIISAAMYHDIAAMNKQKRSKGPDGEEPVAVYHDKTCPLYKQRMSFTDSSDKQSPKVAKSPGSFTTPTKGLKHSESICSCGAMDKSPDFRDRLSSSPLSPSTRIVMATRNMPTVGFSNDGTDRDDARKDLSGTDSGESPRHVAMTTDSAYESGVANSFDLSHVGEAEEESATLPASTSGDTARLPAVSQTDVSCAAAAADNTLGVPPGGAEGKCSDDGPRTRALSPTLLTAESSQVGPSLSDRSPEGSVTGRSPSPNDLSIPRDSGGSPRPSSSPKDHGLLSRTLESLSSLGSSFPGSPNLSSLATGLFSWNQDSGLDTAHVPATAASLLQDRSQEDNDVFMESESPADGTTRSHDGGTPTAKTYKLREDFEVENIVKLYSPNMFKDLSELIPRPATHYEDLPLYLCLRVGLPSNKRISKTCPIESYMKQKHKPEYWFCIPRDKVDPLYAFFLQWSPNIYGSEDEVNAKDRGFVVVNDSEDEADIDIIDDHFDKMTPNTRQMTKDWEIVNLEEARRRFSFAEVENLPLPELSTESTILVETDQIRKLCLHLPARAEGYPWTLIYSSESNGFSLKTLYRTMHKIDCPILIVVKDTSAQVFGAMLPCAIVMSDHFYGTGESFLFTFYPEFQRFGWSGSNNFFIKGNADSLSIGAGNGLYGLWLDGDLYHGRTQCCETYNNELLTESEDFMVKTVEAWGFV